MGSPLARPGTTVQLRREFVFVQEAAESVASANASLDGRSAVRERLRDRRLLAECAVWPVRVVVGDVLAEYAFEVAAGDDQDPVEALAPGAADPAFRVRLRLRGCDRRSDHADPFRVNERVEGLGQLDVAITDQDPRLSAFVPQGDENVSCLLRHPGAVGMGGDAGDVYAPPLEFDEEEDVEAA